MRAEETWRVWRRILREPALADAVMGGQSARIDEEFGFTVPEREIAAAYAAHGKGVRWAVEGYRFRLVRVTQDAIAEGAPLTAGHLSRAGRDMRDLTLGFVESTGWEDRGPYIYGITVDFLTYLERGILTPGENPTGTDERAAGALLDVLRLERAGAELVVRHSDAPAQPASAGLSGKRPDPGAAWPCWTGRGTLVHVHHDISGWLTDRDGHDLAEARARDQSFLVYLDGSAAHYALVAIGDGAALAARGFADGAGADDVAASLGVDPADAGLLTLMDTFTRWGVLGEPSGVGKG